MAPLHKWLARMAMLSTAGACLWRVSAPMPSPSPAPAAMTRSMERGDESAAQGGGDESPLWHPWRRRCSGGDFRTGGGSDTLLPAADTPPAADVGASTSSSTIMSDVEAGGWLCQYLLVKCEL